MRTRSKHRHGGGIDPPTMSMTIPQIKSYITTYRQEMMSAKEQKMKKADLFAIAMETYHAFRAVENKMAANLQAALKRAPGNHVTNRRTKQSPRRLSPPKTRKQLAKLLLNLPSVDNVSAASAAASSNNGMNNLIGRFSRMSIHNKH